MINCGILSCNYKIYDILYFFKEQTAQKMLQKYFWGYIFKSDILYWGRYGRTATKGKKSIHWQFYSNVLLLTWKRCCRKTRRLLWNLVNYKKVIVPLQRNDDYFFLYVYLCRAYIRHHRIMRLARNNAS